MSTLVNLLLAVVANVLTIIGVPQEAPDTSSAQIIQCENSEMNLNNHIIIKNEQLSQKFN